MLSAKGDKLDSDSEDEYLAEQQKKKKAAGSRQEDEQTVADRAEAIVRAREAGLGKT